MTPIDKLSEYFSKFPGIGSRQSARFTHFILSKDSQFIDDFTKTLLLAKSQTGRCASCYHFFSITNETRTSVCERCSSPNTNKEILMVVEKDVDLENVESVGVFDGNFFVLGSYMPILNKKTVGRIRDKELIERVNSGIKNGLKEIIIAFSLTPEGENTARHIMEMLEQIKKESNIKISVLGRGFSTGTELEYSDSDTLKNALKNRS